MLAKAEGRCDYCHRTVDKLTVDHVVPLSRGGADELANVRVVCQPCNCSKGRRTLDEWKAFGLPAHMDEEARVAL
jgi:5-methylcytosine-specific restriction endonuclease McrA